MSFHYPIGGGSGGGVTSITGSASILATPNPITGAGVLELVNDVVSPGNSYYYGTDGSGTKGFFVIPSGSIGGSIASTQVAFGSGVNTIAGSNNFIYDVSLGDLDMFFGGNGLFRISPSTGVFSLGNWSGGGNGMALILDDGTEFYFQADSGKRLQFDQLAKTYKLGDIDFQDGHSVLNLDDTNNRLTYMNGLTNLYFKADGASNLYQLGEISGLVLNNTYLSIDATADTITLYANLGGLTPGAKMFEVSGSASTVKIGDYSGAQNGRYFVVDDSIASASFAFVGGDLDTGNNFIHNLKDPLVAQDAATKAYVDSFAVGLSWKTVVRLATAAALPANTYSNGASGVGATLTATGNGALSIDGTATANGNRVLIKNEVAAENNGIYVVTDTGSAGTPYILTRATDNDTAAEQQYSATAVTAGSANINTAWTETLAVTTMGTDPIMWVQFLSTAYSAGAGLTLAGNTFSLDLTHANVWTGKQSFSSNLFALLGASSGETILRPAAIASGTMTLPSGTDTLVALALTQTLTNKRVTKRVGTVASSATPTINTDNVDYFSITALATNITSMTTNLSGTPTDNQTLWVSFVGTATRTIAWGSGYESSTIALPTTTVSTDRLDVGFVWNPVTSKWRCVATC